MIDGNQYVMLGERMEASLMYWSKMKVMESGIEQKNNLYIQIPILCYYFSDVMLWETSSGMPASWNFLIHQDNFAP